MAGLGRNFWRMWTASALSNVADGAVKTALPLVAVTITRSPPLVAGVAVAAGLPWLLFALQAGALADRLDRRRTMAAVNLTRGAVLLVLAALTATGNAGLAVLYATAFVLGVGETLFDTSAQSILPSLVERSSLSKANSRLYAAEVTGNQFVGPPLGGFLTAAAAWTAFASGGVTWLLAGLVLLTVAGEYRPAARPSTTIRSDIGEGVRYLVRHRVLRTLAVVTGVTNLGATAVSAIMVLYAVGATSPMKLSEAGFGLLLTALAVGSLAGAAVAAPIERRLGRANALLVAIIGMGAGLAGPALHPSVAAVAAWFILTGLSMVVFSVIAVSLRQGIVPDRLLGRVNAGYRLVAWGTIPIGSALGGVIAGVLGLRAVFVAAGAVTVAMVAARFIVTDAAIALAEARGAEERAAPA